MYRTLVISGGASKVLSVIGVVRRLEESGSITHVRRCAGTSAGALMSLMITLGYGSSDMRRFAHTLHERGTLKLKPRYDLFQNFGLDTGESVCALCRDALAEKQLGPDTTFETLREHTGRDLIVCVTNLSRGLPEYLSRDTEPHMPVVKAIRMSCSIPLLFTPVMHRDCVYVDGGLTDNVPLTGVQGLEGPTLVIWASTGSPPTDKGDTTGPVSLRWFVWSIVNLMARRILAPSASDLPPDTTLLHLRLHSAPITVDRLDGGGYGFRIDPQTVQALELQGYEGASQIISVQGLDAQGEPVLAAQGQ